MQTTEPKRHSDHITEAISLHRRVRRTYSHELREHAVWLSGTILATAHRVGPSWSVVMGDPEVGDGRHRKFIGLADNEADAIQALEGAALTLVGARRG